MSGGPKGALKALRPAKEFFIGIDSDGCAFDTMEIKHKECFCPRFVDRFRCQAVSKYARETWEFVNLYSKWRGTNRWEALARALNLLRERPEARRRGAMIADPAPIEAFVRSGATLSNEGLREFIAACGDAGMRIALQEALDWSIAVNDAIERMVHDIPPFPCLREALETAKDRADMLVVSQTPTDALEREWREHGLDRFVRAIAGQEAGRKSEHIALAAGGKYPREKILMIGDALGDLKAAHDNQALFYPINPGAEEESWKRFRDEALGRFFAGTYAGAYEQERVAEFDSRLPETPPWRI